VVVVGECAEHRGAVYGLVAPIYDQAQVAADTLVGRRAAYGGSVPSAMLKVAGIDLVAIGDAAGDAEAVSANAATGVYRKLVLREGRAAGAILLGDVRGAEALLESVRSGDEVGDALAALAAAAETSAADLPAAAQVCNCHGVCKGQIAAAVRRPTSRRTCARARARRASSSRR